ncbi:hypothetical protein JTB14_029700 [Gonioctena quinquepunctata]|nr:hypothetical protein JTB14_029700 [Gonioctena quinquepunctata]
MKRRNKYEFLKNLLILCENCKDHSETSSADEKSVFEQTINELTESTEMMNSQIEKLTQNNNLFADEAVQREDELNDIIKSQEEIIRESSIKIDELQIIIHNLTSKPKQTTSTQTEANNSSSKLIPPADKNKRIQVSNADQFIENVNKSAKGLVLIDDFVPI